MLRKINVIVAAINHRGELGKGPACPRRCAQPWLRLRMQVVDG